jgi:predicted metalloprotease
MDQDQNTGGGVPEVTPPAAPSTSNSDGKNQRMLIGAGIAVLILVILGWYMMQGSTPAAPGIAQPIQEQKVAPDTTSNTNTSVAVPDAATVALSLQGTSDDVADIDADLKATDLTSLNDIDQI